ncbi:hypothetical protein ANCCAN_10026 [Ancylostoma caninum]|uniref:Uncharacterized protein n=1 Tax=Ancylostoma caninum TaxID=29170 RepID=A0A368GL71_ANCCA|nr:hypothetical protein ANCCAN_10026 [Ancylostoma caninum]
MFLTRLHHLEATSSQALVANLVSTDWRRTPR